MSVRIQLRRDTAANWASTNPTLTQGEPGYETDTGKIKYGDGTTAWNSLGYSAGGAFAAGSASSPSITFTGDTNTGIYSPGADQVAISTNGTGRLFVDASGNVGVNLSAPVSYLDYRTLSIQGATTSAGGVFQTQTSDASSQALFYTLNGEARLAVTTATPLAFITNNTEKLRITSDGKVGIGTSAPSQLLHLQSSGADAYVRTANGTVDYYSGINNASSSVDLNITTNHPLRFFTNALERARIDTSGRLLVGTSTSAGGSLTEINSGVGKAAIRITDGSHEGSAGTFLYPVAAYYARTQGNVRSTDPLAVNGSTAAIVFADEPGNATYVESLRSSSIRFYTGANNVPAFLNVTPTERMRITNAGVVGTFSNGNSFVFSTSQGAGTSTAFLYGRHSSTNYNDGTNTFIVWSNGNVVNTNNSYGAISDAKLKENIVDANSQWADLKALQVRKYNFKEGQTHTQIGLIAQEAELVSPGLVSESPDRDAEGNDLGTVTKSVNYSVLYMKAVKALQEAMERIETLEAKVAALEGV